MDFERAAELRDALQHLSRMEEPTVVLEVEGGDRDVIGYARDGDDAVCHAPHPRRKAARARAPVRREHVEEENDAAVLSAYLARTLPPARGERAASCSSRSMSRIAS